MQNIIVNDDGGSLSIVLSLAIFSLPFLASALIFLKINKLYLSYFSTLVFGMFSQTAMLVSFASLSRTTALIIIELEEIIQSISSLP